MDLYPSALESQFPHIFNKLVELKDNNQFSQYLNDVIFDSRGGRQGFPPEVVSELWKLQWHRMRVDTGKNSEPKQDYWNWINKKE
jgi:tankyrase